MPIASSQYWNSIHGREKGQAELDAEGLQTMRVLARNMSFLIKCIALGKEKFGLRAEPARAIRVVAHSVRSYCKPKLRSRGVSLYSHNQKFRSRRSACALNSRCRSLRSLVLQAIGTFARNKFMYP